MINNNNGLKKKKNKKRSKEKETNPLGASARKKKEKLMELGSGKSRSRVTDWSMENQVVRVIIATRAGVSRAYRVPFSWKRHNKVFPFPSVKQREIKLFIRLPQFWFFFVNKKKELKYLLVS